ncbi:GATA zinc finger domain-containing protein 4-like [Gordionus sp. m RMFG-2023]|uniref:GATA zinc finger domain-containing protein 4-like n=1 Tax=Gordionus sp. m RMFG-2023 TaxID=3053472 RepID=UPI0031FD8328
MKRNMEDKNTVADIALEKFLFNYRNTPNTTYGHSTHQINVQSIISPNRIINSGDKVWFKVFGENKWDKGTIKRKYSDLLYEVDTGGFLEGKGCCQYINTVLFDYCQDRFEHQKNPRDMNEANNLENDPHYTQEEEDGVGDYGVSLLHFDFKKNKDEEETQSSSSSSSVSHCQEIFMKGKDHFKNHDIEAETGWSIVKYLCNPSDKFGQTGFRNWKNALAAKKGLLKHESSKAHLKSITIWHDKNQNINKGTEITKMLGGDQINRNQYYIKSIFDLMLFLSIQELPFRGTGSTNITDATKDENIIYSSEIFIAMFSYTIQKDPELNKIMKFIPQNAQFTSPQIQNEVISIMTDMTDKDKNFNNKNRNDNNNYFRPDNNFRNNYDNRNRNGNYNNNFRYNDRNYGNNNSRYHDNYNNYNYNNYRYNNNNQSNYGRNNTWYDNNQRKQIEYGDGNRNNYQSYYNNSNNYRGTLNRHLIKHKIYTSNNENISKTQSTLNLNMPSTSTKSLSSIPLDKFQTDHMNQLIIKWNMDAIAEVLFLNYKQFKGVFFTECEKEDLKEAVDFLRPFYKTTLDLSGSKYPTVGISMYMENINNEILNNIKKDNNNTRKEILNNMRVKMQKYLKELFCYDSYVSSTLFDPRLKQV